jgi:hypothetical protein
MDLNTAMIEWLHTCPQVSRLYALWGAAADGAMHYLRMGGGVAGAYLDGGTDRTLDCAVLCFHRIQSDDPRESLLGYAEAQAICDWVTEQDARRRFPAIPGVYAVACPAGPQIAGAGDSGLAKYTVGIRVWYGP